MKEFSTSDESTNQTEAATTGTLRPSLIAHNCKASKIKNVRDSSLTTDSGKEINIKINMKQEAQVTYLECLLNE